MRIQISPLVLANIPFFYTRTHTHTNVFLSPHFPHVLMYMCVCVWDALAYTYALQTDIIIYSLSHCNVVVHEQIHLIDTSRSRVQQQCCYNTVGFACITFACARTSHREFSRFLQPSNNNLQWICWFTNGVNIKEHEEHNNTSSKQRNSRISRTALTTSSRLRI